MRLADLRPRWFAHGENARAGFAFLCPHCRKVWLTCKSMPISMRDQMTLIRSLRSEDFNGADAVPTRPEFAWAITGEFDHLTVAPSIDASASGHWHGFITSGNCSI